MSATRIAARAIRDHVTDAQRRARNVVRARVVGRGPLRVELITSGMVLAEDDDFTLSASLDGLDDDHPIKAGDTLLLMYEAGDYTAFDVEYAKRPRRIRIAEVAKAVKTAATTAALTAVETALDGRLDTLEALTIGSRLTALEGLTIGSRLTALEARPTPRRVVGGAVNGNTGAGSNGTGFTSSKIATGQYQITFTTPWTTPYQVHFGTDQGSPIETAWTAADSNGFVAHMYSVGTATHADLYFNFTATEIR